MKGHQELIQFGMFYCLLSPFGGNVTAWIVVSEDQKRALVGYCRVLQHVNDGYHRIRLQGLNDGYRYHVSILDENFYDDELMNAGLIVSNTSSGENHEAYDGTNGGLSVENL